MSLFTRLSDTDKHLFWQYLSTYGDEGRGVLPEEDLEYFLRYWNENKEPFFRAFNNKFIIKKEICFSKSIDELAKEMRSNLAYYNANAAISNFVTRYESICSVIREKLDNYDIGYNLSAFVSDYHMLSENIYSGTTFTIPAVFTKDHRDLVVPNGCKLIKMLGKIVAALNANISVGFCEKCNQYYVFNEEQCPHCNNSLKITTGYEVFRQFHSQILNQKSVRGNLCLSIHPLDFVTMSDNDCGWNSCMQWMEDTGDYRLGTIEMMNSPCVVIAYVESHDPMKLFSPYGAEEWNNKKWRQLYIIDRTIILGNRQYPYDNLDLQGAAITWLRDIMNSLPGYGPYPNETINLNIQRTNVIKDKRIKFNFYTNYMYNDVYDYKLAFIADQHLEDGDTYDINFSGPAVCNRCGKELELNEIEAHQ